ncbi:MAG: acyl-CoA dehydrogenase family protein [Rhodobacteraceae bacterium]|nr:acyl-CoA dehydrogenase family protein [Paracoccaceae bacterium]
MSFDGNRISGDRPGLRQDLVDELCQGLDRWQGKLNDGWLDDDRHGRLDPARWRAVCDTGLTGLTVPEDHGGLELSPTEAVAVMEHFGRISADGGLGFTLASHLCSTCVPVARFGSDALKDRLLGDLATGRVVGAHAITEPDSGSDAFSMRMRAERDGQDYILTGEKCFISNAPIADICVVYARTDPDKGALSGFSAFAVDRRLPGFTVGQPRSKLGLRTAPMADLHLDGVRVPASARIGAEGQGFSILDYVMKWEILCVFAVQVGEMRTQLKRTIDHARTRKQFGQAIGRNQGVSHRIADMHMRVEGAANWLARAAQAMQNGRKASLEIAAAKLAISEANVANSLDAITLHGGAGYMAETGIEAGLRNAVGGLIYSGTSEIQRGRIAAMLGL